MANNTAYSSQIKQFVNLLPQDLSKNITHVSQSKADFYGLIESELKTVYGDSVDWETSVTEYYKNADGYRKVNDCESIPELTFNDIQDMLFEEQRDVKKINDFINNVKLLSKNEATGTDKMVLFDKCSKFLGIYPVLSEDAFFRHLIRRNGNEEELYKKYKYNGEILNIVYILMEHLMEPGMTVEYPEVGAVITQQMRKYYYRGENAFYGSSKPSIYRGLDSATDNSMERLLRLIRVCESWNFFDQFDAVKYWNVSAVNYMALSQHYGLRTYMMDFTTDLHTALFFMCCKYVNGKWYPLSKEDIANKNSRTLDSEDSDARYGILHRGLKEIFDIDKKDSVIPVGYQPFMRCNAQYGYMLLVNDEDYDLYKDGMFEKFKVRLTPELCQWIYEEMDEGDKVYPQRDIPNIEKYVAQINRTKTFTEHVVKNMLQSSDIEFDFLRKSLRNEGIMIKKNITWISQKKLSKINGKYGIEEASENIKKVANMAPIIMI